MDLKTIGIGIVGGVILGVALIGLDHPRARPTACEISFVEFEAWVAADEAVWRVQSIKDARGCGIVQVLSPSGAIVLKI